MVRVHVNISRGAPPAPGGRALTGESVFGIVGATTHVPSAGATYTVPTIGEAFVIEDPDDIERGGSYDEGTLGKALKAIEAFGNWPIIGVRHDEGVRAFRVGASMDDQPAAGELGTASSGGKATLAMYSGNMYHLVAVPADEPDLEYIYYSTDPTANVIRNFTKFATAVTPTGLAEEYKVWVSNAASALAADVEITAYSVTIVEALDVLLDGEDSDGRKPNRITSAEPAYTVDAMGNVDNSAANPVATKMESVCESLNAVGYPSGPGSNITDFLGWLAINRADRLIGCGPTVTLSGETAAMGMGPVWAGAHCARIRDIGFWANPNGADVQNVRSMSFRVDYNPLLATAASSRITAANGVSMFRRNGFHLLGGDMMTDPMDEDAVRAIQTRLILDDLRVHAADASARGLELNIGTDLYDFVMNIVRARLRFLVSNRALNSGDIRLDDDANSPAALAAGDVYFELDTNVVKRSRNIHLNIYFS